MLDLYHVLLFYVFLSANFVAGHQNVPIVFTMVHGPLQMNQHIGQCIEAFLYHTVDQQRLRGGHIKLLL